jgi:phosphoribosyl 1,2-cyclic phosphodiesterase
MTLKIKLFGCRGSLPSPRNPAALYNKIKILLDKFNEFKKDDKTDNPVENFLDQFDVSEVGGFGGNTISIDVKSEKCNLIIDAGSGIRELGYEYMQGACGKGEGEFNVFLTHFHWDHLIGLPFFIPLYIKGNKINFYAVQPDLADNIKSLFKKPFFPVTFDQLPSDINFHILPPREKLNLGDIKITPYQLDHPDPCWGFKLENDGKVFSHCVDSECSRMSRKDLGDDLPLYQNVDLLLFDAQYSMNEITMRINWGHSAAPIGLDIALREGVKKIVFMHHDPAASDERILEARKETENYLKVLTKQKKRLKEKVPEIEWVFAYEGMEIEL